MKFLKILTPSESLKQIALTSVCCLMVACSQSDDTTKVSEVKKPVAEVEKPVATVVSPRSTASFDVFGKTSKAEFVGSDTSTTVKKANSSVLSSTTNLSQFKSAAYSANSIRVNKVVEERANGKLVDITISAKAPSLAGSHKFGVIYWTLGNGNSGVREFSLTQDFKDHTFQYLIPETNNAPNFDVVSILSDLSGQGRAMEISSIEMAVVN